MPNQRNGLLASVPPGSKNQAKAHGASRNLGRPCRLHANFRLELPDEQLLAPAAALGSGGSEI